MATITVHAGGSIQAAIDSANNGDTIFIENGVYNEQVSIAGRVGLTLQGESEAGVVITSPASIVQNAVDATTGRLQDALIAVSNSSNITIENVKIDGADRGNTIGGGGSGNDFVGIAVANSTGQIDHVDVTGIRDPLSPDGELSGVQHGNAIVITNAVGSPLAFTVSNSSIENYQKTAIIARNTIATLTNNDIDGGGPHNVIAQNGIQLSSGSTGTVTGNHISGIGFTPDSNDVVGVLVFDSHGSLNISGNTFDGTTANDVFAYLVNTSGATVTANTINHTETGVVDSGTVNTPNSVGGNTFSDVDTAYSFDPDPTSTPYNVTGTEGNDILHGGAGNDHIDGLGGIDTIDMTAAGAAGSIVNLTSGLAVSTATGIDTLANVENVLGSAGNDTLIGDANDNTFFATAGTDNIDGRGGNDTYDASSASASVLIDLDGGYAAGGLNGNLTSIENAIGGSGDDFIAGGVGANILSGNAGSDTFFNLHNGDVVHGGSGVDTAVFTANVSAATFATGANHVLNVTVGGETVALDSVEKLQFNDHNVLVVGAGGQYATIQAAINASHSGDTIIVTAGVYQENLNVNVSGLTIEAAGAVTVQGTLKTDNGIPDGGLSAFLSNSSPTVNVSGNDGVIISADNVTLRGINVDGFYHAVKFGDGRTTAGATFDGVTISDSVFGYEKSISAGINGLNIIGGSISGGYVGIDFNQDVASAPNTNGATDVTIDGTLFSDLNRKGIYAETLSDAHITNITMSNVGQYGSGPLDGSLGTGGNGIDLNLKNGVYSDVEIDHFHLTNTGASDQADQAGHPVGDKNGGAIVVEARDQGSYASTPGTFTGSVNIHDGTIDGQTSTGIQAGEPGQNNAGPMVIVNNVDISGAEQNALHGSIANVTQSTMTVTGTAGADDIETSVTSTGAIEFHGGAGADTFVGHNELDTATYGVALTSANITYNTVNHQWVVDAGAEGVDHLSGVEKITDSAGHTFILAGNGYGTIQAAINAAHTGDTILVAAGDYNGNIDVNVAGVTIKAMGDVTIHGTFKSDNGIADGDVASFLQTAAAYTGAAGSGVTISANNVTIEGLHLDGFLNGVQFADNMNVSGATFNDVAISDSVFGYWKGSAAGVSGLTLNDGAISDSYIGVYFQKNTTVGQSAVGNADHVVIDGTSFTDITQKGIYAETLSDAHITNIAMDNVGQYGGGPAFGADGNAGNGINLNLKNGSYSNIEIDHFTLHDVGASDGVVSGGQANGGAIVVEARDQGSYAGTPGTFSGAVNIHDGSITGHTSTGIQAGEPTQTNAGPIVTVTNVTVDGASQNAIHGDITNETQSVMTLNGTAGADEVASSASSTGAIVFHGGGGADTFTGHGELDTATYNVTLTSADITYDQDAGQWVVNAGADGVDRLSGVEKITDGTHTFILAGNGYASIQAAVDAAGDGDTILIAAGTWAGDISVNDKQLTFLGINHGIDGAGDGRAAAESAILGKVQVFGDKNVTFDGIEFLADDNTGTTGSSSPALGFHGTGDYRVTNSVFYNETTGGATDARAISLDTSVSGAVTIDHNAFTGDAHGNFGDASWGRGIWSDGTSSHLDINNNSFEYVRSGINLDGYSDATHSVTDNVFVSAGTGISVGAPNGTTFTGIHDNDFQAVGDDFNFQNVTTPVTIDLTANPETSSGGDVGLGGGVLQILGGKADDHITGSAGADNIFGNNGNDVLKGGGGADLIVGGAGTDTAVYSTNITVDKLTAVADLGATLGNQSGWIVNAGANEGTDTLVGVEVVSSGTGHILLVGSGGFATIQDAVNAAGDGDIILIAAGTWAGDVSVNDKQLTFLGVNHGIDGAGDGRGATESAILGKVQVFGDKNVTFDGIEFLADDNTGTTGSSSPALGFHGTGDYRVTNSVFYNETTGGATDARAISLDTSVSGAVTIDHNAFTGDAHGNFGDASWGRGIWSDGTSSHLDINNNSFEYVRSGINLDSYDDASHSVTDNVFVSAGTGISVGAPNGTTFTGIHDNDFQAVGDDFNFQNVTTPVTIDLTTNPETSSGGDVGLGGGVLQILGGKADDHITGSAGADNIFGNNGNDVLKGGGGADLIVGGAGTDTAVYSTNITVDKLTAVADLGATLGNQSGWTVNAGANEGTDTLVGVEVVRSGTGHILLVGSGGFATIQDAVNAASDGDTILLAAGTYDEDVTVTDKELTFAGANFGTSGAGSRGAESVIHGRVSVSGSKAVAFNGLEFLADNDTGTIGHGNAALQLHGSGTYTVHNSVFYSDFVGGSVEATAIQLDTSATGTINIESNLFTGSQTAANMNLFGGANWQRGIWSDGAEHQLNITDNSFSNVRSAVNLDGYDDTTHHVSENTFIAAGTGISVGIPVTNTYAGIHDNDFQTVNDDFNFQNLTTIGVDLDLTETHNTSTGGVAPIGGVIQVLGSQVADHITGSAVSDVIFGNGGDDIIDGGGGNDTIDGGAGTGDTYVLSGAWSDYVISRSGNTYTITKGGETDTVTNVENFSFHGHVVSVTGDPDTIVSLAPTITGIVETGTDEDNNPGTVAVSEAASAGTVIATVSAADHNIGADDALTFTLVDGAGNAFTGPFSITKNADGVSATIAVAAALNFDLHSSYGFYVKVTDSAGHSVTQATAVSVIDVNGPPVAPAGNNVDVESGKTEAALADPNAAPLNLALPVDLEGDPITFHLTSIQPSGGNQPGTVLLNGVAVTAATLLSAADMQSLTYLAPVTNDPAPEVVALNFEYTDGVNTPANMQVLVNITPAADDSYAGTAGADRFDGGAGNDTYTIDNVGDVVLEQAGAGIDTVLVGSLTSYTLGANVENLTHTASNSFTGTGNELANVMIGGTGDDKLIGGGGDDTLNGGGGSNTAQYSGNHSDYLVTAHSGQGGVTYTVQDLRNGTPDGTDTLSNIAKLQFADGTVVINGNAGTIRHDFDGNGHSDALLVNDNGSATVWDNGAPGTAHQIAPAGIIANGWHFASTGDFDGNGKSDILWVNDNTGQASIWDDGQIGGAHIISPPGTIANGWHFASTGDFDGNGKADILWVNDNTGQASIWDNGQIGSAHIIAPPGTISGGWHFGGTGDFDGNGKSDIAWVNDNGKVSIWDNGQIGGAHIVANLGSDISGWHFAGTGDFDGNSKSDFLWVNDNGRASIWDNGDVTKAHTIAPVGTISNGWSFADTGDYDGNGQTDILWQNSHGQASIWDNGDIAHAHIVASSLSGLHIV